MKDNATSMLACGGVSVLCSVRGRNCWHPREAGSNKSINRTKFVFLRRIFKNIIRTQNRRMVSWTRRESCCGAYPWCTAQKGNGHALSSLADVKRKCCSWADISCSGSLVLF